jgi:hypothetical protein
MPNDAKLGMLVGVFGVLVAAVVLSQPPGQPADPQTKEQAGAPAPPPADVAARLPPAPAPAVAARPSEPQSSPVARSRDRRELQGKPAGSSPTRNDVDARPTSRQGADEEP